MALLPLPARANDAGASAPIDDPTLIALAIALAVSPVPEGASLPPTAAPDAAGAEPQLELVATIRAKSVVFSDVPKVNVAFAGAPRRTFWKTERVNLPARVEPGVTYRDVVVRLTLSSTAEDMAVLLRDAKRASAGLRIAPGDGAAAVPTSTAAASRQHSGE
jgi:hypothetical protein